MFDFIRGSNAIQGASAIRGANKSASSLFLNTSKAHGQPALHDVLRNYQVADDTSIDYQPRVFGAIDIPFAPSKRITETEGELLDKLTLKEGLLGLVEFKALADNAFEASKSRYPDPSSFPPQSGASPASQNSWAQNDGHRDAFRHAYWNAQMVSQYGDDFAEQFGTAHEGVPGNFADREAMDLYNNEVGRQIAGANPNASAETLANLVQQAVTDGKMIVIDSGGSLQWSNRVAYGQHGVANDVPAHGRIAVPQGDAYPNTSG